MRILVFKTITILIAAYLLSSPAHAGETNTADVIVYGSTPGGFCAAIAAAREGASVILLEPTGHIGGMNTGGLSFSDSNQMYRETLMGLFHEWHLRIQEDYEDRGITLPYDVNVKDQTHWSYEPHVAFRVTTQMLADAWQDLDDRGRATELYREAISTAERGSTELLEAYYGLLTSLESNDGDESQLRVCLSALEVFPLDGQLLCALGGYLQAMGRWDLATRSYETAFRYGQVNPETWHLDDLRAISAVCYNLALQLQNKDDEACAILNQALDGQPRSSRLLRALIDLHIKNKRESEALQHVEQLPLDAANRQQWSDVVRGAIHASRQEFNRARPYLQTAFDMGCREIICLRWLAVTLLAHEDQESASKVLDVWQAIDPTNQELASYRKLIVPDRPPTDPSKRVRIDDAVSMPAAPATLQPLNPATSPINSD